jgi:hypothetical protein
MSFPPDFGAGANLDAELCEGSRYKLYCNTILPTDERLRHWYQYLSLALAATAILVPILISALPHLRRFWQRWRWQRRVGPSKNELQSRIGGTGWNSISMPVLDPRKSTSGSALSMLTVESHGDEIGRSRSSIGLVSDRNPSALSLRNSTTERTSSAFSMRGHDRCQSSLSVRELCEDERRIPSAVMVSGSTYQDTPVVESPRAIMEPEYFPSFLRSDHQSSIQGIALQPKVDSEITFNPLQNFDLRITPLFTRTGGAGSRFSTLSRTSSPDCSRGPRKTFVGLVDTQDLGPEAFAGEELHETVSELNMLRTEKGYTGLVLRVHDNINPSQTIELLNLLFKKKVGVMLMCDTDSTLLQSVNFGLLIGLILENSTILVDGQRRGFFQSDGLRSIMDRCAHERVERPSFFLGFNDLWETRPTAAVVRRAFKIAEFFGATLTHGPLNRTTTEKFPISMSGFDYLKGDQIVEVCHNLLPTAYIEHEG